MGVAAQPEPYPRRYAHVAGVAVHLPEESLTTAEPATHDSGTRIHRGVMEQASGVEWRHVAASGQTAAGLAAAAARTLLEQTGHVPPVIELIIYAGVSGDAVEPATAHMVAAELGASCPVFDVRNACNGVLNAIELADTLIAAGRYRTVLIVGGEVATPATRRQVESGADFATAGPSCAVSESGTAMLLEASAVPGVLGHRFCAGSAHWDAAVLPVTRSASASYQVVDPAGLVVGVQELDRSVLRAPLDERGLDWDDMAAICVHQASLPSLHTFCEAAGIPLGKVTIAEHGDLVASTIPAQLHQAVQSGRVQRGDLVALVGVANGVSAGTVLLRW
ncbi:3-oxoacyl-ACP synthase III family protein [Nonomuraea jabiensis]|uniref:3-oxoacyl-[acyl-carrier-protein] synthase-3 n=1 Tax=Nonomuraea jabiensis TaxID=882448 RepID=A0A7W9L8E2_9ACTN|nr:3-oxoacyl-[acyl-carrier-protein] synthase III C-terminal domain-containing protein [Nonomuraea jabiensis]MBB5774370.1 3-oxoacyl-[acyl-carrier-protein] synthase-3 [Nonomuraea jabiensis]